MTLNLYRIAIAFATLPLFIGLLVFLCWYIPRSFYAKDYPLLEQVGLYCYFLFLGGLLIACISLLIWWIQSKTLFNLNGLIAVGIFIMSCFLGQKLTVFGIEQQTKAFVRIENHTGQDVVLRLHPYFSNHIKPISTKNNLRRIFIYQPQYDVVNTERNLKLKKAYLEIIQNDKKAKLILPAIDNGVCKRFILGKYFTLKEYE